MTWRGGRVPDGAEKGVLVCNDSADDFTVTIASPIASFPTNFNVRNLGGGLTTISCAADVEAVRASISVGEGAPAPRFAPLNRPGGGGTTSPI